MKTIVTLTLTAGTLLALASACTVDVDDAPPEETGKSVEAAGPGLDEGDDGSHSPDCFVMCTTTDSRYLGACCTCTRTVNGVTTTFNSTIVPTANPNYWVCRAP